MAVDRTRSPHHVYRCFDRDGRLVYVGSTADLFGRLASHEASSWWAPTVAKVNATLYRNGIEARAVERRAIRDEVPRWNKSGKWAGRANWARDDWHDWLTVLIRSETASTWTQLCNSIRDYESLFSDAIPEHLADRVAQIEARRAAERREADERDARRSSERVNREAEELSELNAELRSLLARQERLARALGIDWDDPELLDPEAAIDRRLAEINREKA